jgi:hypothetical protein
MAGVLAVRARGRAEKIFSKTRAACAGVSSLWQLFDAETLAWQALSAMVLR